jgi:hypothetical protein
VVAPASPFAACACTGLLGARGVQQTLGRCCELLLLCLTCCNTGTRAAIWRLQGAEVGHWHAKRMLTSCRPWAQVQLAPAEKGVTAERSRPAQRSIQPSKCASTHQLRSAAHVLHWWCSDSLRAVVDDVALGTTLVSLSTRAQQCSNARAQLWERAVTYGTGSPARDHGDD